VIKKVDFGIVPISAYAGVLKDSSWE
jgi:hypothetical protein